ncbi:MAG: phosphate butyryltransferase [Deltaproteobacteria bacterium]|nr:phosphate butyryltransferase [Deltaproteobacteria bacterium]
MIFDRLLDLAKRVGRRKLAVAGAEEADVLRASVRAAVEGIATVTVIGRAAEIERIATEEDIDLDALTFAATRDDEETAVRTVELVRSDEADVILKGRIHTKILMREAIRGGLRPGKQLLSHVSLYSSERFPRPVMVTDAALNPYPTLEQRIEIVKNAVTAMRALGVEQPRVALLAASEGVDEKFPCTVDAAKLVELAGHGGPLDGFGHIDGPLDLGSAIDPHAAEIKGVGGEVAGRADIFIAPDVVSGNLLGKAVIYFAGGRVGGCVMGASLPIAMVSRASPADDKYRSILFALACAAR